MAVSLKIELPSFFEVGENKIEKIFNILKSHDLKFKHILLMGDRKTFLIGGTPISKNFQKENIKVTRHLVTNSDEANVMKVKKIITRKTPDLILGFGGGKVLDVAKLAAGERKIKFISIPTTLSNDGISSPVSVIKGKNNIPVSHITTAPYGVIVDINIIKKAPIRHIKAGIGDLISNLSAVFDARLAHSKGLEKLNDTALSLAEAGALALLEHKTDYIKDDDFLLTLTRGLIKSGFAMCIVGSSRPASGSEHKISHSIDHLYAPRKNLHGEQTGIATLFTMALQENQLLHKVKTLYSRVSFPRKIRKLYLNKDQFIKAVFEAVKIRPDRYTILEEKNLTRKDIIKLLQTTKL